MAGWVIGVEAVWETSQWCIDGVVLSTKQMIDRGVIAKNPSLGLHPVANEN
jgi:hypothetical protein